MLKSRILLALAGLGAVLAWVGGSPCHPSRHWLVRAERECPEQPVLGNVALRVQFESFPGRRLDRSILTR